jgi:hypothetical protein
MSDSREGTTKAAKDTNTVRITNIENELILIRSDMKSMMESVMKANERSIRTDERLDEVLALLKGNMNNTIKSTESSPTKASAAPMTQTSSSKDSMDSTINLSSPFNISSSLSNGSSEIRAPAAIDSNQKIPEGPKLPLTNTGSGEFTVWVTKMISGLKGTPKYDGIINVPYVKSWESFKRKNSKYSINELEIHYVSVLKSVWTYIYNSIDSTLGAQIDAEFQRDIQYHNIPRLLLFHNIFDDFYEDPYAFMERIKENYQLPSNFRLGKILSELSKMEYDGKEDPKLFIARYLDLHNQGSILVKDFPHFTDNIKAHHILDKLPKELEWVVQKYYGTTGKITAVLSVGMIEDTLRQWWIKNRDSLNNHNGTYLKNESPFDRGKNISTSSYVRREHTEDMHHYAHRSGQIDVGSYEHQSKKSDVYASDTDVSDTTSNINNDESESLSSDEEHEQQSSEG